MSPPVDQRAHTRIGLALFLTAAVFLLDLGTPFGWADWLFYFIPLVLILRSPRERDPYYFVALITFLMLLAGSLHQDFDPLIALFNRCLGIIVMWAFTWILVRESGASIRLAGAIEAQAQAETRRQAAVEARELAESSLAGAIYRESQTAQELLVSKLRLEGIFESAMDAILTVDEEQRVLLFNRAAEHMFRCSADHAIGQPLDMFIPARFHQTHREHIAGFGKSGETSRKMGQLGSVFGVRSDGVEFPVEAAISQITVQGKKYYTVILRDITERKQAEQLMRQSEERYRRLISVSPIGIFVSRDDRVIFINDAALRLFGAVKAEEILGISPFKLFHPDNYAVLHEYVHELLEGSQLVPVIEAKIVKLDGVLADVEVSIAQFADEGGTAIMVMLRDFSERRRLQEQLRKTERIAELGTLASGMAHEIGTPMNVILGRAEYLMDRVKEEPVKKGLQTIVAQVERITKVMNQLLAFARRTPTHRTAIALSGIIENSIEMFHERFGKGRIRVELHLDEQCPQVRADPDQMSQVLINLIMNAVHAMPEGGVLSIELTSEDKAVTLIVGDTGHGIPQEAVGRIFEPFFTTKEFGKGTGLGLTVVKGIVEEHLGTIAVESKEQKGTIFTIRLPRIDSFTASSRT